MLRDLDLEAFARDGIIRFRGVVARSDDLAAGVWAHLAGRGIARDDASTWPTGAVHHLHGVGRSPELDRGEAGDIVFAHPLMAHCVTPNCGARPRIMRILRPLVTAA